MTEAYQGEVAHVHGAEVVVVYDVDGDLVEHTYNAKQFIGGWTPKVGDQVEVFVQVAIKPPVPGTLPKQSDVKPKRRKNTVTGPQEF